MEPKFEPSHRHPVLNAIEKFKDHPSILKIKSTWEGGSTFKFKEVSEKEIYDMVMQLDSSKKTSGSISNKILKLSVCIICPIITKLVNSCFKSGKFPDKLKLAEITPVPKNGDSQSACDYRPISILPAMSKLFEKVIAIQLHSYFETFFSKFLCGFRKRHSTQHALMQLLRSWQQSLDNSDIVGTILMDLSKAYDCLPHDLLIAKLAAYGVDFSSLCLINNYLTNRFHRVKIGTTFSKWLSLLIGVPQGSVLGPLFLTSFQTICSFSYKKH